MGILNQPNDWIENNYGDPGASPPRWWEAIEADGRFQFYNDTGSTNGGSPSVMDYTGAFPLTETELVFDWEVLEPRGYAGEFGVQCQFDGGVVVEEWIVGDVLGTGQITIAVPPGATMLRLSVVTDNLPKIYNGVLALTTVEPPPPIIAYNCQCDDERLDETLGVLRTRLMRRLGFSAQVNNPPPGMAELLDDFLHDAQSQLYRRFDALRTERYFKWTMQIGVRYYGVRGNDDDLEADGSVCDLSLDPYRITWIGVEHMPLAKGIAPELYAPPPRNGLPCRYEVRQCIEVFPPPDRAYVLLVKGHFGLQSFVEDEDQTSIDSNAVFLYALGLAKAHYGKADAGNYIKQAMDYAGALVSGAHHTRRYVPRAREEVPLPQPRMTKWDYEP